MKASLLGAAALLAGAFAAAPSFAQSSLLAGKPYVGVGVGSSQFKYDCDTGTTGCDKSDTAYKLVGGWEFPNRFAAEVTYFDLGRFREDFGGGDNLKSEGSYWGLGGAYRPDFGHGWGGVARVGAAYGKTKVDYSLSGVGAGQTNEDWHPYYGLGVNYEIAKGIKLEADWDNTRLTSRLQDAKSTNTVNSYTLGASFSF